MLIPPFQKFSSKAAAVILPLALLDLIALGASIPANAEPIVQLLSPDAPSAASAPLLPLPVSKITPTALPANAITLIRPKSELWSDQIEARGSIMPWQEAHVGTEIGGLRIASVLVSVGDTVAKGQVLARLDTATVETDLEAANAQLMEAEGALSQAIATLDRGNRLAPSGGVSQQDLTLYDTQKHTAEARVNAARSQVKRQQLRLQFATLIAPDDGIISASSASEGTIVQAGSELFRLIRQGRLEWRAEVRGETLLKLTAGQEVTVNSPFGTEVKGRIRRLSPTIDVATHNGLVYVDLPEGTNLKAGLNVSGTIEMGKRKVLLLPSNAILRDGNEVKVLKVNRDNKLEGIDVKIGRVKDDSVEIVAGLDERSLVVGGKASLAWIGELVESSVSAPGPESKSSEKNFQER